MFFWVVLASLMGIVLFGSLSEKTKDQEFFVEPVYESLALNLFQYHTAVVYGYEAAVQEGYNTFLTIQERNPDADPNDDDPVAHYFFSHSDGIVPLATVEGGEITKGGDDNNPMIDYITPYLPVAFKPQNNTRSYLFCVSAHGQTDKTYCTATDAVRYIMTFREIPPRYAGADKMLALRAVAKASTNSRNVGMIEMTETPLAEGDNVYHQPIGSHFYIMASGYSPATSAYIPDYAVCKAPRSNTSPEQVLGDKVKSTRYLVALSIMQGLEHNANIPAGSAILDTCKALEDIYGGGEGG